MIRNFIFVFILLTTLSIVNAIPFNKRTLKHDITADKTLLNIDFYDTSKFLSAIPPYNKNFTESFKAGTKFSIDVDNVSTPDKLPLFYAIIVTVGKNLGEDVILTTK
uniref:Uncharacterized protein n=1 Tax=Rhizophagus irregularis (strain DAOM 181602 / DAOM 197198 / MUCL 43194) TaxID=747089 RepID=U9TGK7_RHIID